MRYDLNVRYVGITLIRFHKLQEMEDIFTEYTLRI